MVEQDVRCYSSESLSLASAMVLKSMTGGESSLCRPLTVAHDSLDRCYMMANICCKRYTKSRCLAEY